MRRRKVRKLVQDVLAARDVVGLDTVTFDTLDVDFVARSVRFRGRSVIVESDAVSFPVLTTERLIIPRSGDVW